MYEIAGAYVVLTIFVFVAASLLRADVHIVLEAALSFALGSVVRIAVDKDATDAFWFLVVFGGLLIFPIIELLGMLRARRPVSRD